MANKGIREEAEHWFARGGSKENEGDVSFFEACDLGNLSAEEVDSCIIYLMSLSKRDGLAYARLLARAIVHEQRIPTPSRLSIPSIAKEYSIMQRGGNFSRTKSSK